MITRIGIRLSEELDRKIEHTVATRRMFKERWVIEAITEHLRREGIDPGDTGPLAGLSQEDCKRVERFIKFLRVAPRGLKEAADLAQRILAKALAEARIELDDHAQIVSSAKT